MARPAADSRTPLVLQPHAARKHGVGEHHHHACDFLNERDPKAGEKLLLFVLSPAALPWVLLDSPSLMATVLIPPRGARSR